MKHIFVAADLLFSAGLARSALIGAELQRSNYDPVMGITTVRIANTSHKEISALGLALRVTFPDVTMSAPGANNYGLHFLDGIVQGKGGFAPRAV